MQRTFVHILFAGLLFGVCSNATTLFSGEVWEIQFEANTIAHPCPGTCDTLELSSHGAMGGNGVTGLSASVYNGNTLLGTFAAPSPGCCSVFFESSSSLLTIVSPTVIDFSSFQNGTFVGRIDYSFTGGSETFDPTDTSFFFLSHSTSGNSGADDPLSLTILSAQIIAPEPSSLAMLALGVGGLYFRRRRAR
jgi:hypothetical protein